MWYTHTETTSAKIEFCLLAPIQRELPAKELLCVYRWLRTSLTGSTRLGQARQTSPTAPQQAPHCFLDGPVRPHILRHISTYRSPLSAPFFSQRRHARPSPEPDGLRFIVSPRPNPRTDELPRYECSVTLKTPRNKKLDTRYIGNDTTWTFLE